MTARREKAARYAAASESTVYVGRDAVGSILVVRKGQVTALDAAPLMRPLWALRYFVRFGCSMTCQPCPRSALKPKPEGGRGVLASGRLPALRAPDVPVPWDRAP